MELDIEDFSQLQDYFLIHGYLRPDEAVSFTTLSGGVSNRTVRAAWPDGRAWVVKQALAKLRVNTDWYSSIERIRVEAEALRWFNRITPLGTTPAFVFEDFSNHMIAMEAIPEGHENWKSVLLRKEIVQDHFEQFGALLGAVHRQSSTLGPEVRQIFENTSFFESLRVDPYYAYSAQTTPEAESFLTSLTQEMRFHRCSLVHGDFSPKNTLLYRGKLILLDYEVVHWGDPAFDVGFALTHFLSKAHHLPAARASLTDAALLFWHVYSKEISEQNWATVLEPRATRHTIACLLARVAGKSPLEYLTTEEVRAQRNAVLSLIADPPITVNNVVAQFIRQIEKHA